MILAQEPVGLKHANDQQDRNEPQGGGVHGADRQLPVNQEGQDRDSEDDVDIEHGYHPFGVAAVHDARTARRILQGGACFTVRPDAVIPVCPYRGNWSTPDLTRDKRGYEPAMPRSGAVDAVAANSLT
jgi:hypothetical protein